MPVLPTRSMFLPIMLGLCTLRGHWHRVGEEQPWEEEGEGGSGVQDVSLSPAPSPTGCLNEYLSHIPNFPSTPLKASNLCPVVTDL